MNATIIARTPHSFTLQVEVPYNGSMLDFEETLQQRLNEAGVVATAEGLRQFDTDGSPITVGPIKLTTKGQVEKDYQTPYGVATAARHVYQSPQGGATYCPLDRDARIVVTSTPRFAKIISHKYAEFSSPRVQIDLDRSWIVPPPTIGSPPTPMSRSRSHEPCAAPVLSPGDGRPSGPRRTRAIRRGAAPARRPRAGQRRVVPRRRPGVVRAAGRISETGAVLRRRVGPPGGSRRPVPLLVARLAEPPARLGRRGA